MAKLTYYIPGIILIFMGVLIFVAPQIIVAFVSAFVLMIGLGLLYVGHKIRKSETDWQEWQGPLYSKTHLRVFRTPFEEHLSSWN